MFTLFYLIFSLLRVSLAKLSHNIEPEQLAKLLTTFSKLFFKLNHKIVEVLIFVILFFFNIFFQGGVDALVRKLGTNVVKSEHAQSIMNQIDFASFETDDIDEFVVHCKYFCLNSI